MKSLLSIDGRSVPCLPGETILEAARGASIHLPTLCYHRKTGVLSTCRVCVVEIEGRDGLHPACSTAVEEGMRVHTDSDIVRSARRAVVDLLLSSGDHQCRDCPSGDSCQLQSVAAALGLERGSFARRGRLPPRDASSPMIAFDPGKCILCGRCVKACRDVVMHDVLGVAGRATDTRIVCDDDLPMGRSSCVQCGECVQLCPTGAFLDKTLHAEHRSDDLHTCTTVCPYCGVGCGIVLHVDRKAGRIVRVTGAEEHPASEGMLCVKGRYGFDFIHSRERLSSPLVRQGGELRRSTWPEALARVAEGFLRTRVRFGSSALAGLSSAKCTNEENYLFQKLFRTVLGTNNVDHCARLCHSSTVTGLGEAIGSAAMTNDIAGIPESDVILVIGSDTTTAHPIIAAHIRRAVRHGRSRLMVIDPRRPLLADDAEIYASLRSGTDVAVLNGMMHIIIANGWEDAPFIAERCEGYRALKDFLKDYDPHTVAGISGIPAPLLHEMAQLFGTADTASVFYAMGITQHTTGTENVRSLANLQLLCGNFGKRGGGLNPLRGQCNVQGACDMGALPASLPGYVPATDELGMGRFEREWGSPLPRERGLTSMEMIDAAAKGSVRALYVMGENPCLSDPHLRHVSRALGKLDLLVVQDIFLTETARRAHVVLPAACFAEKDGLFTSTERRVQRVRKALEPPGEAREDWRVLTELARLLGEAWEYASAEEIHEEVRRLVPTYHGITWKRASAGGVHWPCGGEDDPGTDVLHRQSFPAGKGKMLGAPYRPPHEEPNERFPFTLTTGRLLPQFHTGTMTRKTPGIDELAPARVEIAPADAAELGISEGDMVELSTPRGSVTAPARLTERLPRGMLFMAFHFAEAAVNLLTNPARDPSSGIPEFKCCAAALKRAGQRLPHPGGGSRD